MNETEAEILVARSGSVGRISLNRPKALNSLTLGMVRSISEALDAFEEDSDIVAILITAEGERAFCAGGDIRALYENGRAGNDFARTFLWEEYRLNARIARFPKPYIAIMDGITMGGGVGLSAHGSHRIVTERTRLAMPETGIGFFPDVGATWLLSHAPGELGTFLGLAGERIGAADAIALGLADFYIESAKLGPLGDALSSLAAGSSADAVSAVINRFASTVPTLILAPRRAFISQTFAYDDVEEIVAALEAEQTEFGGRIRQTLLSKSPTSLKITLKLLRLGRLSANLEACLEREFSAAAAVLKTRDFYEGVRAAVIDKDRNPQWSPHDLASVDNSVTAAFFVPFEPSLFSWASV